MLTNLPVPAADDETNTATDPGTTAESVSLEDTSFKLNILVDAPPDEENVPEADVETVPETEEQLVAPMVNTPAKSKAAPVEEELALDPIPDAEQKAREQAEIARRLRMYEEMKKGRSGEEAGRREESQKSNGKKKKRKDNPEENSSPGFMRFWKKGVMVVAALFVLYWTTSVAWGFIHSWNVTTKPVPVEVSKARINGVDGQALPDVTVRFYPQKGSGLEANAVTDHEGKFGVGTFTKSDGAVPKISSYR